MSTLCEGSNELFAKSDCTPATESVTRSGPADRRTPRPKTYSCKIPLERLLLLGYRPHVGANQARVNLKPSFRNGETSVHPRKDTHGFAVRAVCYALIASLWYPGKYVREHTCCCERIA
jgi:hypothetical protein